VYVLETVAGPHVNYSCMLYELLTRFVASLDELMRPADQHQGTCPSPPPESDDNGKRLPEGVHALPPVTQVQSLREERTSLGEHH